jgi:DNA-binding LacI/PurR family transcriptional regulator
MARYPNVTIKDVAARAGVSITAVSHALNDKRPASASGRSRSRWATRRTHWPADCAARRSV